MLTKLIRLACNLCLLAWGMVLLFFVLGSC